MNSPANLLDKRAKLHSRQIQVPENLPPRTVRQKPQTRTNVKVELPRIGYPDVAMWKTSSNSIWPFCTMEKPSCGYFFSRLTDNKKRLGIPPSTNTVKWRNGTLNHAIPRSEKKSDKKDVKN